jgi:CheY-like chemotaxis protein
VLFIAVVPGKFMNHEQLHILIVDDTIKNIELLDALLREENYQINVALNGQEAIKVAQKVHPDLILLDVMMPELDGFETCKRLKADPQTRDIPIIFLTARSEIEDMVKGFDLGAIDYLAKPFNATELRVRVRTQLNVHLLQSALRHSVEEIARLKREHEAFLRHELNNRMTPVQGYAEMLVKAPTLDEKHRRWAGMVYQGVQDMTALISGLKTLQDIEVGHVDLHKITVNLDLLIRRIIGDLETVFNNVSIHYDVQMGNANINAAPNLLHGVFQNLIKNAIEHIIQCELETTCAVQVRLFFETCSETREPIVVVQIQNGGHPIPKDRLVTFFEKFNTDGIKKGGTGLGTTYAYLVTKAHHGNIGVTSTAEEGTIVTVKLPQQTQT